ncbi:MAG: hypothetical protein Q9218_005586 [Villophora microphyllina]
MIFVALFGFQKEIIRKPSQSLQFLARISRSYPGRRWLSCPAGLGSADNPVSGAVLSQTQKLVFDDKDTFGSYKCFSIISDHTRPLVSLNWSHNVSRRSLEPSVTPLLLLLITPSHCNLIEDGHRFIPNIIRQTHDQLTGGRSIDVLVAVVDSIPYPAKVNRPGEKPHRPEKGCIGRGISVLLLNSETATPDLWSSRKEVKKEAKKEVLSATQRRNILSFHFDAIASLTSTADGRSEITPNAGTTIKLSVANTLFHNGRESTIEAQRWTVGETSIESTLTCTKRTPLGEQAIRLVSPSSEDASSPPFKIDIPLVPITKPRVIASAMGNVLREVFTEESSGEVQPASEELEGAVTQWIAKHESEKRTVDVWAMVKTPQYSFSAGNAGVHVLEGGRIQKVLSGGGGWGNKQGLLALDHEQDFNVESELSSLENSGDGVLSFEEVSSGHGHEALSDQDSIRFYVIGPVPTKAKASGQSWELQNHKTSFVFGTTPSTIDAMPLSSSATASDSTSQPCVFAPGHFGMLSEYGMTFGGTTKDGLPIQTKIDVPFASILCGEEPSKSPHMKPLDLKNVEVHSNTKKVRKLFNLDQTNKPTSAYEKDATTTSSGDQLEGRSLAEVIAQTPIKERRGLRKKRFGIRKRIL